MYGSQYSVAPSNRGETVLRRVTKTNLILKKLLKDTDAIFGEIVLELGG